MTHWQRPPRPRGWRRLLGSGGQGLIQAIGGLVIGLIALLRCAALLSARVQLEPSELNRTRLNAFLALLAAQAFLDQQGPES